MPVIGFGDGFVKLSLRGEARLSGRPGRGASSRPEIRIADSPRSPEFQRVSC
jgi:hypothetical protein